ncbi:serine/threonine-protein kinase [Pseudorhodoferax sp.]|uniref:serine/threonine-protein kinase n=1 Tax=Pseudorhodoferax sp. TaxID=1993553 RepID=UPI002DD670D2|nr:serine/threonine-protein kinase [Pseudorhodoferax sp.]
MADLAETVGSANCLPAGSQVGEYRLLRVVGEGGFGVVYEARDLSLDRIVAVKEYMPSTLAGRMASNQLQVRSQHRGAFDAGLRSFINEARLLAKFSHPALVHVYRFFEANGTAYMVMRYYEGMTFKALLAAGPRTISEAWLSAMLAPVLDVLEMLHAADCYHRDISPDNIFLQSSGGPVLLDFGAARRIIGDLTQALTMVLKPGFAPIEQYVDDGAMQQGAWTDIYQLGAMLFLAVTGRPPATAVARLINDPTPRLTPHSYPGFSARFLQGIQHALAVKPEDRPQSIAALRDVLGLVPGRASAAAVLPAGQVAAPAPVGPATPAFAASEPPAPVAEPVPMPEPVEPPPLAAPAMPPPAAPDPAPDAPASASLRAQALSAWSTPGMRQAAVGTAALLMASVLLMWWNRSGQPMEADGQAPSAVETTAVAAPPVSEQPAQSQAAAESAAPPGPRNPSSVASPPVIAAVKPPVPAPTPAPAPPPERPRPTPATPAERPQATTAAPAASASSQAERPGVTDTGTVVLRVTPWGRVSVNRVVKGTAPPLRTLQLPEGEYRIEITNPVAAPVVRTVHVKKGESVVLQHKFE